MALGPTPIHIEPKFLKIFEASVSRFPCPRSLCRGIAPHVGLWRQRSTFGCSDRDRDSWREWIYCSHQMSSHGSSRIRATPPAPVPLAPVTLAVTAPTNSIGTNSTRSPHLHKAALCAIEWRTHSGVNTQVVPVRHCKQSVMPSTSSGSTA